MKKYLLLIPFLVIFAQSKAQQDPGFTHYMYNMSIINPAYATGTPGIVNVGGFYRSQWVGSVGGPQTFSFFTHVPVNEKIETGISFVSDVIGDGALNENNIFADFAYILNVSEKHKLSLGLKAGATFLNTNFSDFRLESGNVSSDPSFEQDINKVYPNIGTGAFFYTDNYYIGLSTPNFLTSKHIDQADGVQRVGGEEIHFYLTAGYVFKLTQDLKFKPSFLARTVSGVPPMLDVSASVMYVDRIELGVSHRFDDSFSALMSLRITENLRFGYAYDYTTTNLGNFNSGSHEIFLLFDLNVIKGYDKSPRFY